MAAESGQVPIVKALLQSGKVDVNAIINVSHSMSLQECIVHELEWEVNVCRFTIRTSIVHAQYTSTNSNPQHACAARDIAVVLCVCVLLPLF